MQLARRGDRRCLSPTVPRPTRTKMFSAEDYSERADWSLLQNGAVSLFYNQGILKDATQSLAGLGYEILNISCRNGIGAFRQQFSQALKWEEQFGYTPWNGNLDALSDGIRHFPYRESGRAALVFDGFDKLVSEAPEMAHTVLDIIECEARDHLLWSKILIALVQTDDPRYDCPPIGGRSPRFNWAEWTNSARGV
jgi:hypothetical protein